MPPVILGLDIGGANLKAATSTGRALSVPFAVWKHPDQLGAELAKLIGQFPEANSLAVTMTAELCDCYETKREGVNKILDAVAACGKPFKVWSTDGKFISQTAARKSHIKVAAANWHALATFAGRFVPKGPALLIDMGTTTTDFIPMKGGRPNTIGKTDTERMDNLELLYMGWKRTPLTSILPLTCTSSELFATTQDALVVLKIAEENPSDRDTADGRPLTRGKCLARVARMDCADIETQSLQRITTTAETAVHMMRYHFQTNLYCIQINQFKRFTKPMPLIISGSGRFFIKYHLDGEIRVEKHRPFSERIDLGDRMGEDLAAAAPAYAVAVLAAEAGQRPPTAG